MLKKVKSGFLRKRKLVSREEMLKMSNEKGKGEVIHRVHFHYCKVEENKGENWTAG